MDWITLVESLGAALIGGGLVKMFTMPEAKMSAKLDNAQKVIDEYTKLMDKYKVELDERDERIDELQARIEELENKAIADRKRDSQRIAELEDQVRDLTSQLNAMKAKRNARGQFVKVTK